MGFFARFKKFCNICNVCNLIADIIVISVFLLTELVLELINDLHL